MKARVILSLILFAVMAAVATGARSDGVADRAARSSGGDAEPLTCLAVHCGAAP